MSSDKSPTNSKTMNLSELEWTKEETDQPTQRKAGTILQEPIVAFGNHGPMVGSEYGSEVYAQQKQGMAPAPKHNVVPVHRTQLKPAQKKEETLVLPPSLGAFDLDMSMGFMEEEEEIEGDSPPILEAYEAGSRTAIITSADEADVLNALKMAMMTAQSENKEISFSTEGWSLLIQYTYAHKFCQSQITILQNPSEFQRAPNMRTIHFQKLRGDSFTFQRFYRETVERLSREIKDLRALNGNYLPSLAVMELKFDATDIEVEDSDVQDAIKQYLRVLSDGVDRTIEPKREASGAILQIAVESPQIAFAELIENAKNFTALCSAMRDFSSDFGIVRNIVRLFSTLIENGDAHFARQRLHTYFHTICGSLQEWTCADGESKNVARVVSEDLVKLVENVVVEYYLVVVFEKIKPHNDTMVALEKIEGCTEPAFDQIRQKVANLNLRLKNGLKVAGL